MFGAVAMTDESPSIARILVAFDSASAAANLMDAAAGLALGLQAELACLLVEDERLVRLAALPFARELGVASARSRPLDPEELARSLRVQAERVRSLVASTAKRLSLAWSLQIVRGQMMEAALSRSSETDLLVLGRSRYRPAHAPPSRHVQSLAHRPVAVLFDGSEASLRALYHAHTLARVLGSPLLAIIPAAGAEAFRQKRAEAARRLQSLGGAAASYLSISEVRPEILEGALRERHVSVLVWPQRARTEDADLSLLERLSCPVVLDG